LLTSELIDRGARNFAGDIAIVCDDKKLTFREVDELANRFANALIDDLHLEVGERVGTLISNSPHVTCINFACARSRSIRVHLNARQSSRELAAMFKGVDSSLLIYSADLAHRARADRASPGLAGIRSR
jgi:acyl-CoA synthetase (AMP-forming)/AMP-acid ligase II